MDYTQLSQEDRALFEALADIAQSECLQRRWADVEPMLAYYWSRSHRESSPVAWEDVAAVIRSGCDPTH